MFTEKIYYFATHKKQKDYFAKYSGEETDALVGGGSGGSSENGGTNIKSCEHDQQGPSFNLDQISSSSASVAPQTSVVDLASIKQGQEELKRSTRRSSKSEVRVAVTGPDCHEPEGSTSGTEKGI